MISLELLQSLGAVAGIICILLLCVWLKHHLRNHK